MKDCFIAIDPGNEKTGVAVLTWEGMLKEKCIVPTEKLTGTLETWEKRHNITLIACGNGTNHKAVYKIIKEWTKSRALLLCLTEEAFSTEEARKRYWKYHPPKGIKKLLPLSFLFPPEPVDDFTAWIIGERFLQTEEGLALQKEIVERKNF